MTDDDSAPDGRHDHALVATLAGAAVLVAAALAVPRMLPPQPLPVLAGGGAAAGLLLWLIALVATMRRASAVWKAGSLAILVGAGALAGYLAHRQFEAETRLDPSGFAEMEFGADGQPEMRGDVAARGPLSRRFAALAQANVAARRDYGAALGKFGVGNLSSPYLLARSPEVLGRCGEVAALRTLAQNQARERAAREAEMTAAIRAAALPPAIRDGIAAIALSEAADGLANQLASLDATEAACTLLARRTWFDNGGYFGFRSAADMTAFKALQTRQRALASEAEQIDRAATARMKAGQEKVRDALQ